MRDYSLLEENLETTPQQWFDAQVLRHGTKSALKYFIKEEVIAVFCSGMVRRSLEEPGSDRKEDNRRGCQSY